MEEVLRISESAYKRMPRHLQAAFKMEPNPESEAIEALFPQNTKSEDILPHHVARESENGSMSGKNYEQTGVTSLGDSGSASRYFYCAKPSQYERSLGVTSEAQVTNDGQPVVRQNAYQRGKTERKNIHPTVKPVAVMHHLVTLITPPNGVCVDPFCGSGTTGIGAMLAGPNIRFVGCEFTPEYIPIIHDRMKNWKKYRQFIEVKEGDAPARVATAKAKQATQGEQGTLFEL